MILLIIVGQQSPMVSIVLVGAKLLNYSLLNPTCSFWRSSITTHNITSRADIDPNNPRFRFQNTKLGHLDLDDYNYAPFEIGRHHQEHHKEQDYVLFWAAWEKCRRAFF